MFFQLIASLLWFLFATGFMPAGTSPIRSGAGQTVKESRRVTEIAGLL